MNPFEFIGFTPGTNCGECGHPTCLAFAVAVTKGGLDPGRCPYVDPAVLQDAGRDSGTGLDQVARGQEERDMALVAYLKSKVRGLDFASLAARLGAILEPGQSDALLFRYLGREVVLGKDAIRMLGRELVDPRDQILLYNYVASGGSRVPLENWVGMESLPDSISKVRTLAAYCEQPLATRFAGRSERLAELCARLDARSAPPGQSADFGAVIPVLPHVPIYLLFWDGEPEEGFDSRVKVLFDEHVLDFLDIESLVFASERLAEHLAELDT